MLTSSLPRPRRSVNAASAPARDSSSWGVEGRATWCVNEQPPVSAAALAASASAAARRRAFLLVLMLRGGAIDVPAGGAAGRPGNAESPGRRSVNVHHPPP